MRPIMSFFPVVVTTLWLLSGCSTFSGSNTDNDENDIATPAAAAAQIATADEMFETAKILLDKQKYKKAIEAFKEIDTTYPYSKQAIRGKILSGFAAYESGDYDGAVDIYDNFVRLHPNDDQADYAYYMRARAFYDRLSDVGRDQGITLAAHNALLDVIRRFPESSYAKDAKLKLELAEDHLAGKEMNIGRFYQKRLRQTAAINRFKTVLEKHQTTSHIMEALFRMTECYLALGITDEAMKYAAILGYNYPKSPWYEKAYDLMQEHSSLPNPGSEPETLKSITDAISIGDADPVVKESPVSEDAELTASE